jgi:hypothetical protein
MMAASGIDCFAEEDEMGSAIGQSWTGFERVMFGSLANSGEHTFHSKSGAARRSTPDLTMFSSGLSIAGWKTLPVGCSDH